MHNTFKIINEVGSRGRIYEQTWVFMISWNEQQIFIYKLFTATLMENNNESKGVIFVSQRKIWKGKIFKAWKYGNKEHFIKA